MSDSLVNRTGNARIEFYFSGSGNYEVAVQRAMLYPNYQETVLEKTICHSVTFPLTNIEAVVDLWDLVKGWSASRLYINGERASKRDLVYKGLGCYSRQKKSYSPRAYCHGETWYTYNIWGCWQLGMQLAGFNRWIDYGIFDDQGVWHFDKARIKHELLGAMRNYEVCPAFDKHQVLHSLELFPNSVDPRKDKIWEYKTSYRNIDGHFREVAVGVQPILRESSSYIFDEFSPTSQEVRSTTDESTQKRASTFVLEKPKRRT